MHDENHEVLKRLKTASGQLKGIIKMVEEDQYCIDVSNQILANISLLKSTNKIVLSNHLSHCVKETMNSDNEADVDEKLKEIDLIIEKLSK